MRRNSRFPTKVMLLIRVAVAGYLLYLSYGLYKDRGTGSIPPFALAVILVVFVICAVGVIAHSAYLYMKGMYAGGPADVEVEDSVEEAQRSAGTEDGSDASDEKDAGAEGDDVSGTKALEDDTFSTEGAVDATFREVDEGQEGE